MKMKKNLIDYELLWEKITDYVKATSRTTARPVLLLYYVLRSPETCLLYTSPSPRDCS